MEKSELRKITTKDGTIMYTWNNKLHNWDKPALVKADGTKEYYLHGIQMTEKDWKARRKEREGLPFYKTGNANVRF